MVRSSFRPLGREAHLQLSLTSLVPEEWEAFPGLIVDSGQQDADRSPDWHFYRHAPSSHTVGTGPRERQRYSLRQVALPHSEPQAHDSEHIPDWYCEDSLGW